MRDWGNPQTPSRFLNLRKIVLRGFPAKAIIALASGALVSDALAEAAQVVARLWRAAASAHGASVMRSILLPRLAAHPIRGLSPDTCRRLASCRGMLRTAAFLRVPDRKKPQFHARKVRFRRQENTDCSWCRFCFPRRRDRLCGIVFALLAKTIPHCLEIARGHCGFHLIPQLPRTDPKPLLDFPVANFPHSPTNDRSARRFISGSYATRSILRRTASAALRYRYLFPVHGLPMCSWACCPRGSMAL